MLTRKAILSILHQYQFDTNQFIILSGSSLVLYKIKEETKDIDIAVSRDYYDFLQECYHCKIEKYDAVNHINVYFINNVINFCTNYYDVDYQWFNGYRLQTIASILVLKQSLNLEKDQNDIQKIKAYLKIK